MVNRSGGWVIPTFLVQVQALDLFGRLPVELHFDVAKYT